MPPEENAKKLLDEIARRPRAELAQLPTAMHRLKNFGQQLHDQELWTKRDDLTGLEGGGNKTRKLEFLVGEAIESGADMLVTAGAIQSNHTRQTAAAAAKAVSGPRRSARQRKPCQAVSDRGTGLRPLFLRGGGSGSSSPARGRGGGRRLPTPAQPLFRSRAPPGSAALPGRCRRPLRASQSLLGGGR